MLTTPAAPISWIRPSTWGNISTGFPVDTACVVRLVVEGVPDNQKLLRDIE